MSAVEDKTTRDALKEVLARAEAPVGPGEAAKAAEKNPNTVRTVLRQMFRQEEVVALNDSTYCLPEQFPSVIARVGVQGEDRTAGDGAQKEARPADEGETDEVAQRSVPVFTDVSAGPGIVPAEEAKKHVRVSEAHYRRVFGAKAIREPHRFGYCKVDGGSAVPFYFDGELVPVEVIGPTQKFTSGSVYVFRWLGDLQLKQLIKHPLEDDGEEMEEAPAHRVEVRSLDRTQGDRVIEPSSAHDFAVLARVIQTEKQQLYSRAMRQIFDGTPAL